MYGGEVIAMSIATSGCVNFEASNPIHFIPLTPVLYEDPAPMYDEGYNWLWLMTKGDIFLVVGASTYTNISYQMREYVRCRGVEVVEIQEKASVNVRKFLEEHKDKIESFEDFKARVDTESWYH